MSTLFQPSQAQNVSAQPTTKLLVFAVTTLLLLGLLSATAHAFDVQLEATLIQRHESSAADLELGSGLRFNTGLGIGPIRLGTDLELLGDVNQVNAILALIQQEDPDFDEDSFLTATNLGASLSLDWPLPAGFYALAGVGYHIHGFLAKEAGEDAAYGLYQGLAYEGGAAYELRRGLRASAVLRWTPHLSKTFPDNDEAGSAAEVRLALEYEIPFFLARAGYRRFSLEVDDYTQKFSGLFASVGIHF